MSLFNNAITGAAGQQGYTISRSVRLRSSASAYFNRTPASASNRTTWTWSGWFKRGVLSDANLTWLFGAGSADETNIYIRDTDVMEVRQVTSGAEAWRITSTQVFRDPAAWYHFVVVCDTTQATSSNRLKVYVNGVQITAWATASYPAQNNSTYINNTNTHYIGKRANGAVYCDGYMAEINFIDGQALTPSSFGETDSITGVWKAKKYSGTYGTNGFYLNFSDNSSNTATTIGKDYSGNGNNWTPNNISVTSGVTYDSMVDSPTVSAVSSNYCVLNPLDKDTTLTLSNGNLSVSLASAGDYNHLCRGTIYVGSTDKIYFEATLTSLTSNIAFGLTGASHAITSSAINSPDSLGCYGESGGNWTVYLSGSNIFSSGLSVTVNDVIMIAVDRSTGKAWVGRNGTWFNSGNPASGTGQVTSSITFDCAPSVSGQNSAATFNFGQRPFTYTPPTGFVALNTYNLPASTIKNGAAYMAATTYTGTGSTQSITNTVGSTSFQPDFVWIKSRSNAENHNIVDSIRGAGVWLASNLAQAETNDTGSYGVSTFNSNGFTVISNGTRTNASGYTYIGWQWKAGGTAVSNTDGTITTTVSANPSSGFSVMTYTGTGIDNKTIGHGLGAAPKFIIWKPRASATDWMVWHAGLSGYNYDVRLNTTAAQGTGANPLNNTAPSSTVITLRNQGDVNGSGTTIVCYAFSAVAGYSAFGSYVGANNTGASTPNANGPFVYTGFRPRFVLIKRTSAAASWVIYDSVRGAYNANLPWLYPNASDAESSTEAIDFLSNGFKIRSESGLTMYPDGATFIYAAFAENPTKYALAR